MFNEAKELAAVMLYGVFAVALCAVVVVLLSPDVVNYNGAAPIPMHELHR